MKICLVTPAPRHSRKGNRVTANRWAKILRRLGHETAVRQAYDDRTYDLLIALHARRSYPSVKRFISKQPNRRVIVALTGTDLYGDILKNASAQRALKLAWRLIILQPMGLDELSKPLRNKTRVIPQSVQRIQGVINRRKDVFEVCVLGHLRTVKDPFRAAMAARLLPASSRVRIIHLGSALSERMAKRARWEELRNPRYRWLGDLPRWKASRVLARSRALVQSSKLEGGANAVSEAIVHSVPVIASRVSGTIGQLGARYPGYYPVGDTRKLALMLDRFEIDTSYRRTLTDWCRRLAPTLHPDRERDDWRALLSEHTHDTYR